MTLTSISHSSVGKTWEKFTPENLLEGIFWGSWCSLNVVDWRQARNEIDSLKSHPESVEKSEKVWEAKKQYILSSFSLGSSISMVTTWLEGVEIVNLGLVGIAICALGYGGSAVVSTIKACDTLREFDQVIFQFDSSLNERKKGNIALAQLERLIKTGFLAAMAFWGVFGALHTLIGGEFLFTAMDSSFYFSFLLFIAYVSTAIGVSILKKKV